jgi:hypothetical protein
MRSDAIRIALAGLMVVVGVAPAVAGNTTEAAAAADCPPGERPSVPYTDDKGLVVTGGKCIPGDRVPGSIEFTYVYTKLCQANVPDDCAPRPCEAEGVPTPSYLFAVSRMTLATGITESMGGGCYTTKNDPPKVKPGDVLKALQQVPIPKAAITVQPPGGRTLVNFKTIVSSDAAPFEVDVTIFDQNVHLWIKPVTWTWDFGDDSDPLVREGGGVPWNGGVAMSEISEDIFTFHEYTDPTTFDIGLTVTWTADYQVGSDPPQAVPGSVDITSPTVPIEAVEAIPQLVEGVS